MIEQTNPEMLPEEENQGSDPNVVNGQSQGTDPDVATERESGEQHPLESGSVPALESGSVPEVKRILEAALLSSSEPLTVLQLKRLFAGEVDADNIRKVLDELKDEWADRSIELTSVASGWRFRVKPDYQKFLDRISSEKPPRYSRAVLETLAIIAYRQPVTRGDIEDVRGVAVSPATLNALVERGWVEILGHRDSPGRPAILGTTKKFLDDLNLRSLEELPPLEELQASLEQPPVVTLEAAPQPQQDEEPPRAADDTPPEEDDTEQTHAG